MHGWVSWRACAEIIPINLAASYLLPDLAHAAGLRAFSHACFWAWAGNLFLPRSGARGLWWQRTYIQCRLNTFSKAPTYVFDCAELKHMWRRGGGVSQDPGWEFQLPALFVVPLWSYWSFVLGLMIEDIYSRGTHLYFRIQGNKISYTQLTAVMRERRNK